MYCIPNRDVNLLLASRHGKDGSDQVDLTKSTWDLPPGPNILMNSLYSLKVSRLYRGGASGVTSSAAGWIGRSSLGLKKKAIDSRSVAALTTTRCSTLLYVALVNTCVIDVELSPQPTALVNYLLSFYILRSYKTRFWCFQKTTI